MTSLKTRTCGRRWKKWKNDHRRKSFTWPARCLLATWQSSQSGSFNVIVPRPATDFASIPTSSWCRPCILAPWFQRSLFLFHVSIAMQHCITTALADVSQPEWLLMSTILIPWRNGFSGPGLALAVSCIASFPLYLITYLHHWLLGKTWLRVLATLIDCHICIHFTICLVNDLACSKLSFEVHRFNSLMF